MESHFEKNWEERSQAVHALPSDGLRGSWLVVLSTQDSAEHEQRVHLREQNEREHDLPSATRGAQAAKGTDAEILTACLVDHRLEHTRERVEDVLDLPQIKRATSMRT
jgi:hypothetical protein